ncbi:hypothetical protein SAMN04488029_1718 [Reichenbachiella faecimaris]|uniref:DUF5606 domain-containing protein n=1 Tax=Reichenbachiella faecimaris TaxID=692418 RepID=A0A1W2GB34_REIFA|nr:hypothetical protein [Reichenbachiella faecimaris]SMD33875.1 hypothetical protein SAMN04488029_1718 [Reichenbachiella faecimaris]
MAAINLQKIVAVKGQPGLFHLINYNSKGYFLQPFEGGATRFFSNEKGKVLAVGNVDLKLKEGSINSLQIFLQMKDTEVPSQNTSNDDISFFFEQLIPNLDDSVAPSHLEKVWKWYHLIADQYQMHDLVNDEDDGLNII